MKKRFFGFLTWSHRWIGLTIGLIMVFLAVTGAGQAFRDQLEPMVYSAPACDSLPLDSLLAAAREAHPGAGADSIRFYPQGGESDSVRFSDRQTLRLDPCTGKVTGAEAPFSGFFGTLEYVHRFMFLSDFKLWTGVVTLISFVFLVIGGLVLWWPRSWREAKRSLKVDNRLKGMAFMLNLHKTFGLYAWAVLLVITFSGMAMSFEWVKQGVYWAAGSPLPAGGGRQGGPGGGPGGGGRGEGRDAAAAEEKPALSLEEIWAKAAPVLDHPRDVTIRLPRRAGGDVQLTVLEASAPHARARSELVLDGASGAVKRFTPYAQTSLGNKIYNWAVAIHTGQTGWIGAALVFLASLAVPVLAYSGIASWLRRRASKRALARA